MTDVLATPVRAGLSPREAEQAILDTYDGVVVIASWGETSFFYNPGRAFARGAYFCTIKDHRAPRVSSGGPQRSPPSPQYAPCGPPIAPAWACRGFAGARN
jgi:hypothetical protein